MTLYRYLMIIIIFQTPFETKNLSSYQVADR
jgi:hypothetical protein